jgi:internalin A
MYKLISKQTYWRTGVILKSESNNRAYIKADLEDAKIFIKISGKPATRRSFLSTIRTAFAKVHESIPGLNARQYVPLPSDDPTKFVEYDELIKLENRGKLEYSTGTRDYSIRELLDGIEDRRSRDQRHQKEDFQSYPPVNVNIINQLNSTVMTQPEKPQPQSSPKSQEVQLPSLIAASISISFIFLTIAFMVLTFAGILSIPSFVIAMFSIILLIVIAVIFVLKATGQLKGQSFEKIILAVLKQVTLYDAFLSTIGNIFRRK